MNLYERVHGDFMAEQANARVGRRAVLTLIVSALLTFVVYKVHFLSVTIGRPLLWLSTLVHELGHGLTALLMGGEFHEFVMYADASGVATHGSEGDLAHGLVAAGGLLGPAIVSAFGFLLARKVKTARIALVVGALFLLLILVLFVGNLFAGLFVGVTIAALSTIAYFGTRSGAQITLVFLSMQLAISVFSRGDYLFTDTAVTGSGTGASDTAHMAMAFGGHYLVWGALCGLVSVLILAIGALLFLRGAPRIGSRKSPLDGLRRLRSRTPDA